MVVVISLGGTIAMTPAAVGGVVPQLTAADLIAAIPDLKRYSDIRTIAFRQMPGAHLRMEDLAGLAELIRQECASGVTGVVITQGTDTIEETAYALDLLLDVPVPVVVTGAMRNPSLPGTDGPANLLDAVQLAMHPGARGRGVLVVMNSDIHCARWVRKQHTASPSAFDSYPVGALGWIAEGCISLLGEYLRPRLPEGCLLRRPVRTALMTLTLGDDCELCLAAARAGFDGLVVEAMGGGHSTPEMAQSLASLATQIPVVLTSRTGAGPVLRHTYGFAGSERDLLAKGLIHGGAHDGLKAKVALAVLLGGGASRADIERFYEQ